MDRNRAWPVTLDAGWRVQTAASYVEVTVAAAASTPHSGPYLKEARRDGEVAARGSPLARAFRESRPYASSRLVHSARMRE